MLSSEEYNSLLPDREHIMQFKATGNYNGTALMIIDRIRQRMGYRPVCYACGGSKIEALNDAVNLIIEYEQANKL